MELTIIDGDPIVLEIDDFEVALELAAVTPPVLSIEAPSTSTVIEVMAGLKGDPGDAGTGSSDWNTLTNKPANLTGIAGLTAAADRLPYMTGTTTWGLATFTSFARTILDDANGPAVLSTIGAAAAAHTHAASDITSGTLAIGQIPTGTTGTTVALGNHNHDAAYAPIGSVGSSATSGEWGASTSGGTASGTSVVTTLPAHSKGDTLLVFGYRDNSQNLSVGTAGWTAFVNNASNRQYAWYKIAQSNNETAPTITISGSATNTTWAAQTVKGPALIPVLMSEHFGSNTTAYPGLYGATLLGLFQGRYGAVPTSPSGTTSLVSSGASSAGVNVSKVNSDPKTSLASLATSGDASAFTFAMVPQGQGLMVIPNLFTTSGQKATLGLGTIASLAAPSGTVVGTTDAQTLTTKTIALGSNTISGTIAQFNTAVTDADLATLAGSETLTNKTISGSSNTLSNIALSSLVGLQEAVEDYVAAMFAGGTHSGVTVTYNDTPGTLDVSTATATLPPVRFSASVPETGVTGDDRAYVARTIAECHLRVSAAPVGSNLTVQVQTSPDRTTWTTQTTLSITDGSSTLTASTTGMSVAQSVGHYLRLNVTAVGSTTPAADPVVDVVFA